MKHPLVDIALPLPLYQDFTYLIPDELVSSIRQGCRVTVPFGKKTMTGFAVGFPESTTVHPLRCIIDVLDVSPVLSPDLMHLARWIADYYCAPLGEVLRSFLPQGSLAETKLEVSLSGPIQPDVISSLEKKSPTRAKILKMLAPGKKYSAREIQRRLRLRSIYTHLAMLAAKGHIILHEKERYNPVSTHRELFVEFLAQREPPVVKGAKQQKILAMFSGSPDNIIPARAVLQRTSASLTTLRSLADRGCLRLFLQEIERKPAREYEEPAPTRNFILTEHQQTALAEIRNALAQKCAKTFLLHGITGSGKTQIYIEAISTALEQGSTAIVLVPEISLTPQIVERFRHYFDEQIVVMHSRMSPGERFDAWRHTLAGKYKIAIGPRSAIFAPLVNVGLIVVDEEHESSYKQFDATPRYHARDVAIMRAQYGNAVVVLGSATPSIESYANALRKKYALLTLPQRIDRATLPSVTIADMTEEHKVFYALLREQAKTIGPGAFETPFPSVSRLLKLKIHDRLQKKEAIIILQNRRGYAPFMQCVECGTVERCTTCDVTMTYHRASRHLRCHYCGAIRNAPDECPTCHGIHLKLHGVGTQRVEEELTQIFPEARILRMDLDTTTTRGSHGKILQAFGQGEADILLGTQMVAKGLDFSRVTLVGVISADVQMLLPDFRSAERTFQLLTQVAGRAGRSVLPGEVIIQSFRTDHYALKHVLMHDFVGFFEEEVRFRREAVYPPDAKLILIELKSRNEKVVQETAQALGRSLKRILSHHIILGPVSAVISRIRGDYRWHLIIKTVRSVDPSGTIARSAIRRILYGTKQNTYSTEVKITVDVDPYSIL